MKTITTTRHATAQDLRWSLLRMASDQSRDGRVRVVDCDGGAIVYDDHAGTATRYLVEPFGESE